MPPGFGAGADWRVRVVEWTANGQHCSCMIGNGMPVNASLHAYYWAELKSYRALMAQAQLSTFMLLKMNSNERVGYGCIHPTDGPEEIAWLSCMFGEVDDMHMAFHIPNDIPIDTGANGLERLFQLPL